MHVIFTLDNRKKQNHQGETCLQPHLNVQWQEMGKGKKLSTLTFEICFKPYSNYKLSKTKIIYISDITGFREKVWKHLAELRLKSVCSWAGDAARWENVCPGFDTPHPAHTHAINTKSKII